MTQMLPTNDTRNMASSPAVAAGDTEFINYARACESALNDKGRVEWCIAALTRELLQTWRMPDDRFMQLQPDAPYASYLLYLSKNSDLSIVLDIFMEGQAAVVHNHLCWCVLGCIEGIEHEHMLKAPEDLSAAPESVDSRMRHPGDVATAGAGAGEFHEVKCINSPYAVSLHIYGADIGRIERCKWDDHSACYVSFRSGYSNESLDLPSYLTPKDLI